VEIQGLVDNFDATFSRILPEASILAKNLYFYKILSPLGKTCTLLPERAEIIDITPGLRLDTK
jgi:hypothetical protein